MAPTKKRKDKKILEWLREHKLLPILAIEKAANIPTGTLNRALRDDNIPEKHIAALSEVLRPYGFK